MEKNNPKLEGEGQVLGEEAADDDDDFVVGMCELLHWRSSLDDEVETSSDGQPPAYIHF